MIAALAITIVGLPLAGMLGMGSSMLTDDRSRRKLLEQRVASIRIGSSVKAARVRASGAGIGALLAPLVDPVLGIDRRVASDEPMGIVSPLVMGSLVGACVFAVAAKLFELGPLLAAAASLIATVVTARMVVGRKRDATRWRMEDEFALALGVIIRCVRAGLPVTEGMRAVAAEVVAPTGPEFRRCVDQVQLGGDFDAALVTLANRCVIADYRFFATAVTLQCQTGGNLAETLENLADTIRRRKAVRLKAQALMSETRATVAVLAIMPVAVGAMIMFVSPDYIMQLFTTSGGKKLLGGAMGLQAFGLFVIRTIVRGALK